MNKYLMLLVVAVNAWAGATNEVPGAAEQKRMFMEAVLQKQHGQLAEAEAQLQQLVVLQPGNAEIKELLTEVQAKIKAKDADPATSRTAKLLRAGRAKMAKKVAEEAVEVVIDAMHGDRDAVVHESADLLYNLVVLWVAAGVKPDHVWNEMKHRERLMGIAEKLPKKNLSDKNARRKVVELESRRAHKWR